jgi:sporulation protein YlmC with PRC-barrel domain
METDATLTLRIGSPVACTDGAYGELADLVIAPESRRVTHVVVAPGGHHERARLVEISRLATADRGLALDCSREQAEQLPEVQDTAYVRIGEDLPVGEGNVAGVQDIVTMPIEDYGTFGVAAMDLEDRYLITYDRIPSGEVEVRGRSEIRSSDGKHVGHVDGVVADSGGTITHLLLEHRHLWGSRTHVRIPAGAIEEIEDDLVRLSVPKQDLEKLGR